MRFLNYDDIKKDEVKDAWLDNIDWANINSFKKSDRLTKKSEEGEEKEDEDEGETEENLDQEEDDDEDSLAARILALEHRCLPQAIRLFCEDRLILEGRRVRILPNSTPARGR